MIKSLLENGKSDERTEEYIKELDLNLAERDVSTLRIERYHTDLKDLRKELNQWRNKCAEALKNRDEIYHKLREVQRTIEQLEDEREAKRDRSLMDRSSPNLSACSSMVGGQIPPPPPPPDLTYEEISYMTKSNHKLSSSYLPGNGYIKSNNTNMNSSSYPIEAHHSAIPPPPQPPQITGDMILAETSASKIGNSVGSTGFMGQPASKSTTINGHYGRRG